MLTHSPALTRGSAIAAQPKTRLRRIADATRLAEAAAEEHPMVIVTVMYPLKPGSRFDLDYYTTSHMPMVRARWTPCGMEDATVLKGLPGPDGAAPTYGYMALLRFGSPAALQGALAKHGREVMGDVPNFTDVQPIIQTNEIVE